LLGKNLFVLQNHKAKWNNLSVDEIRGIKEKHLSKYYIPPTTPISIIILPITKETVSGEGTVSD
jgi:hypothetical protein